MENERAIEIIKGELMHCKIHMKYKNKASEYYQELSELCEAYEMAIKALENYKQGKWIYEKDSVNSLFRCSNCGRFHPHDTFVKENDDRYTRLEREDANRFCWHCGAEMRGNES